jgi:hypothetical protein
MCSHNTSVVRWVGFPPMPSIHLCQLDILQSNSIMTPTKVNIDQQAKSSVPHTAPQAPRLPTTSVQHGYKSEAPTTTSLGLIVC